MFDHILIPIDGSPGADYALPHASAIAAAMNARVTLLRTLERPSSARSSSQDPLDWLLSKADAQRELRNQAKHLEKRAVPVQTALLECPQVAHIIEFAREHAVKLIIVAKTGENFGDLFHQLLGHTSLPTLVVRSGKDALDDWTPAAYRRLLIPLDGSQRAEHVLPLVTAMANAFNAEIVLAHVVRKPEMPRRVPLTQEDSELVARLVERKWQDATKYLEVIESWLSTEKRVRSRLVVDEQVASTLHNLIEQEQIDMVILSAHGYSGNPQWAYGSIASNIITFSSRPVLVLQDLPAGKLQSTEPKLAARAGHSQ
jgi:nucleotide-binding universal stress UspA family protein